MTDKRPYAARAAYLKRAVARRRKAMRTKAVLYAGGRCELCAHCTEKFTRENAASRSNAGVNMR